MYPESDTYFDGDCKRLSQGDALEKNKQPNDFDNQVTNDFDNQVTGSLSTNLNFGALHAETLAWVDSLPEDSRKAGWLQVLDEWASLTYYVNERVGRLSRREALDIGSVIFFAAEAAVKVFQRGLWDRGEAKLCTYAKRAIRDAIKEEVARQLDSPETGGWDGPVEGGRKPQPAEVMAEIPPDDVELSIADHVLTCLSCGKVLQGRADADFCSHACRQEDYRRREAGLMTKGELLLVHYKDMTFPKIPFYLDAEVVEAWEYDRKVLKAYVEYAGELEKHLRRMWRIALEPDSPAAKLEREVLNNHKERYYRSLARSPYEENSPHPSRAAGTKAARTFAGNKVFVTKDYDDSEDHGQSAAIIDNDDRGR